MATGYKVSKDTRKYKCPYCDYRDTRHHLVNHVSDQHFEQIPESETAAKIVFDYLNKGRVAKCIVCKKETEWDESKWRYKRICSKECAAKFTKSMREEHIKVHGVATLLNDEDHQIKMLNNRSISGSYKFADGGIRTYVGSYERERLEFLDTVMGFSSSDIVTPGPTIEYEFNGNKHKWITDCYIVPFNLVIDDKPGGSNKNTHQSMKEYNEKQIAKEAELMRMGKYNYVRLTDKDFSQLLEIMMSIKHQLTIESDNKPIVIINEGAVNENMCIPETFNGITLVNLNKETIDQYSEVCSELKLITDIDTCIGAIFVKHDIVLGFVAMDITSSEIKYVYQHDSEQFIYGEMINMANMCWGADSIIVDKRNMHVFKYHVLNGWKVERESDNYCLMTKRREEVITEAKHFTTKDININTDKWFSNKTNVLFITGLSGSGKSTLARDMAKKYNCTHIELDWIDNNMELKNMEELTEGQRMIKEYFEATDAWFDYHDDFDDSKYKAAYNYIIAKIRQDIRKKYIVEGVHVFLGLTDASKDDSIIIKCTSAVKSTYNAAKRAYNDDVKELLLNLSLNKIKDINQGIKSRKISYDTLKSFVDAITESVIQEMNGSLPPSHPHIVAYSDNGIEISGFGITTNRLMDNTFIVDDGDVKCVPQQFFNDKYYTLLKYYNGDGFDETLDKIKELSMSSEKVDKLDLFKMVTNSSISADDQVLYDDRFKQLYCSDKDDNTTYEDRILKAKTEFDKMFEYAKSINESIEMLSFPIMSDIDSRIASKILEEYPNLIIETDFNGYFVKNKVSGSRSVSYKNIYDIQDDTASIINSF